MTAKKRTENMQRIRRQSPEGKAVAVGEDVNDRSVDSRQGDGLENPRIMELEPFLRGCLSVLPERLDHGHVRLGVLLFLLGAADRFWSLRGLDDGCFQPYAESLLQRLGLSAQHAATLVAALPQLPAEPSARRALVQGGMPWRPGFGAAIPTSPCC